MRTSCWIGLTSWPAPTPQLFPAGGPCAKTAAMVVVTRADLLRDQLAHGPLGTLRPAAVLVRVGITGTGETLLVLGWFGRRPRA